MAKFFSELNADLRTFIEAQKVFFVATAPSEGGRINLSPKGMDSLRVLNERTVAYLDISGSGNETAAHTRQNGRMTMMFCSFTEKPLILRLYGKGEAIAPADPRYTDLSGNFPSYPGTRQIIVLHVESAQTSCGFGVPLMQFQQERPTLSDYWSRKSPDQILEYHRKNNSRSIDGLPTGIE